MGLLDGVLNQVAGAAGGSQLGGPLGAILGQLTQGGGLAGALSGSSRGGSGPALGGAAVLAAVVALVQKQGGLGAIVDKLRANGLADHVGSWLGTGANQAVSAGQLNQALGDDAVAHVAQQLGVDNHQAGGLLASVLPELVNQFSPQGNLSGNHADLLNQGVGMLRGLMR